MKNFLFTIVVSLIIGLGAASAQVQDTSTNNRIRQAPVQKQQPTPNPQQEYQDNRIIIQPYRIPSTMRQTLQGGEYRGWEKSTIYQDRITGEYSLQLREGNATPRTYRFDRNGRVIDEGNRPQQGVRGSEGVKDIDR